MKQTWEPFKLVTKHFSKALALKIWILIQNCGTEQKKIENDRQDLEHRPKMWKFCPKKSAQILSKMTLAPWNNITSKPDFQNRLYKPNCRRFSRILDAFDVPNDFCMLSQAFAEAFRCCQMLFKSFHMLSVAFRCFPRRMELLMNFTKIAILSWKFQIVITMLLDANYVLSEASRSFLKASAGAWSCSRIFSKIDIFQ